jgi:hypothetical protein
MPVATSVATNRKSRGKPWPGVRLARSRQNAQAAGATHGQTAFFGRRNGRVYWICFRAFYEPDRAEGEKQMTRGFFADRSATVKSRRPARSCWVVILHLRDIYAFKPSIR